MLTPIPKEMLDVISRNDNLQRYLESLLSEKPHTKRSWLFDGEYGNKLIEPEELKSQWEEHLAQLQKGNEFEQVIFQFDTSSFDKWGPQGGHAPIADLMDEVVLPSFQPPEMSLHPAAFASKEWEEAVNTVIKKYLSAGIRNLYPRAYERVVDDMRARDTLESNSGWPDYARRNIPEVKARAVADAKSGEWKKYPAILLIRYYRKKARGVWMFPMATNIVEGSWFQPLNDAIAHSRLADTFFSPWKGFEQVRDVVSFAYGHGQFVGASDFSSTDMHFQWAASQEVLKVLQALFKPQFADALGESIQHMHKIPLLVGPKDMLVGDHGVSSGSNWTNFIETIFDDIVCTYYFILHRAVRGLYAIGDDMAWVTNQDWGDFTKTLEAVGVSVGQVIKAEKTTAEPNKVKTLQRLFQRNYRRADGKLRAVYPTGRALNSSVYPERFHNSKSWDDDMFCARQFMILENCVDHPLFEEFVSFICKGNWHLIPFAKKGARDLDAIQRRAKLIPGLNPTYNQEKRDQSLSSFASIRVAAQLK